MSFPENWSDFLNDYSFDDSKEVYTNGSRLIPVFRVEQLIEHLLKEQTPRVMTLEEVKASKNVDLYLEISTHTDETPYITAATLDGIGTGGVSFYCNNFKFVAYNRRLYGWRCWTSRPTEEQREAVKWDE